MMSTLILLAVSLANATVEDRMLEKAGAVLVVAGPTLLDRHDLLLSPGVRLEVTHFLDERFGLDYLRAGYFFTVETDQAREIRDATGFVPDREKPRALFGTGVRYAPVYGKLLLETARGRLAEHLLHRGRA